MIPLVFEPICFNYSETKNLCSLLQIIIGALCCNSLIRFIVFWSIECLFINAKNCLGYSVRDSGQSLVPEPPAIITGIIFLITLS